MPKLKQKAEPIERRACRIRRFCDEYDISRTTVWRLAKAGELVLMKAGRRTLVDLERSPFVQGREAR